MPKTQNDNGTTRQDPAANNVTCKNVTVNYGAWMNYTYCDNCYKRLDPGYEYGGHTCDNPEHTHTVRPFDQIFGGGQYGVYGLAAYDGVTVNYPTNN